MEDISSSETNDTDTELAPIEKPNEATYIDIPKTLKLDKPIYNSYLVTDQVQNLEVETPSSVTNIDNTNVTPTSASPSCIPFTTPQNPNINHQTQNRVSNNTNELSSKSRKPQNSGCTLRSHASSTLSAQSGEIKSAQAINMEDVTLPTRERSSKELDKKKSKEKKNNQCTHMNNGHPKNNNYEVWKFQKLFDSMHVDSFIII
ncbi:18921_t:CDS:2 [Dentiscutata erythropus]|uniref:18921_t:CDS:1 n=1 Tax=Dentiscutata erythropus TaxID=1348616 RepID=A0A9N9G5B5_9GLOM|nr:18921_t:CDS:2 [Dentiscutata erythropus]